MEKKYEIHFAPLQGYTDWIYRTIYCRFFEGIDAFYTPFIRLEKGNTLRKRDMRELDILHNSGVRLIPQILPGSADELRLLASFVKEAGYKEVDINLGCPFPLIVNRKKGAGMLPYPDLVADTLSPVSDLPDLHFSLKMRLGWENTRECSNLIDVINRLRLSWVTVHARTGKQQYKGIPDREAFREFYEQCEVPLFYNGDLKTGNDIREIFQKFPLLRGVLIGRGLLSSPFVAADYLKNETIDKNKRKNILFDFHQALFTAYENYFNDNRLLLLKMKSLWDYFLPDTDRKLLKLIRKSGKLTAYNEVVRRIFES